MNLEKSRNQATIMKQKRRRICVSVGVTDRDEALDLVKRESAVADVIEVRLDYLEEKVVSLLKWICLVKTLLKRSASIFKY